MDIENLDDLLKGAKKASKELALLSGEKRNEILYRIADNLIKNSPYILDENQKDLKNAKKALLSTAMQERLALDNKKLENIALSLNNVASLSEVVNIELERIKRPNGLEIVKKSVPIGVIAMIFESRPNVAVDIASLCIKTANACVLKGGKEAINSNIALEKVMREALKGIVSKDAIILIKDNSREITDNLMKKRGMVDLLIPRGSKRLISYVKDNSLVPVIETGAGNCSLYIHEDANIDMGVKIAINAKYSRPSVCNAIENIVVDKKIANSFLPLLKREFDKLKIEIRGCNETCKIIECKRAEEIDFYTEYNDYIVAIKIVDDIDEAIEFINTHSTNHSECIVSDNAKASEKFLEEIDSACVYHNASTRFTDGGEFGFGAELGISTQKLHARGPMGIREMTTYKYLIYGNGQVRN